MKYVSDVVFSIASCFVVFLNLDISPFVGPLIPLFWTSVPWVSKPGQVHSMSDSSPACNGFLRFSSGATPADLMTASWAAEPFLIHVLGKS